MLMTSLYFNLKSKLFIVRKHVKKGMCSLFRIDASDEKTYVYFYTHSRLIKMMRVLSPYIQWNEVGSCINYLLLDIFSYSLTNVKLQFVKMVVVLNDLYVKKKCHLLFIFILKWPNDYLFDYFDQSKLFLIR